MAVSFSRGQRRYISGVTLTEVIIMAFLLVILAMLTNISLRILHGFEREGSRIQSTRDASVFLYNLSLEVRNSKGIIYMSSDTLTFNSYDFSQGYDYDPSDPSKSSILFNETKLSTVTYKCIQQNFGAQGNLVTLQKQSVSGGTVSTKYYFKGEIVMPNPADSSTYIFNRRLGADACPPGVCDYALIHLKLAAPYHKAAPLEYSIDTAVRAFTG
jgi:hypothetical protein